MKKIIPITLAILCLSFFVKAQTTLQEYLYVTAGLKDDFSKGRDVKAGYFLEKLGTESTVIFNGLKKNAQLFYFKKGTVKKAFVVKVWDSNFNYSYCCIPTADADPEVWNLAFKNFSGTDKEWQLVLTWALAKVISQKL